MSRQVVVFAGPARSGKTRRLLCAYRQTLQDGPLGSGLWLSPTHRAARVVAEQLLEGELAGCLSPNLLTFDQLAARVLATAAPRLRPLSRQQVRTTLARLVDEFRRNQKLEYFGPISDTPGFLDLLVGFIRELKRLEIWPEELARAQGRRATAKDRELCALYQAYQDRLTAHSLFDAQGQFWAARQLLREGHWEALPALRHVFVDGFTDFTRTEHEVLELLAARADSLSISLLWEEDAERGDLFEKSRRTLEELKQRHPELIVEQLPPYAAGVPALLHLERNLFGNSRTVKPVDDAHGIEILAAAGVTHEIEQIAGRIKSLLTEGDHGEIVAAEDVLVVFRSLSDTASLVREVFSRFGIPVVVASAPALESAPIAQALLAWLRLDLEDWPFRELLAALGHNYFQPCWSEWRAGDGATALERLVRELELPRGRAELLASVVWHEAHGAERLTEKRRLTNRQLAAQGGGPLARRIASTFDRLPKAATCSEWSRALEQFADELGLLRAAAEHPLGVDAAAQDRLAWQRVLQSLAESDRLARWTDEPPAVLSRRELFEHLQDLLRTEELPLSRDETGCVLVLSAESARGLSAPYVFVAGLSERAFPPPHRDDCLYSDADAARWDAHDLPLPSHELRSCFEMLLFYEVVTRATRQLVLSYPALDAAAQPLVPSPYVAEVDQACGPGRIARNLQPHLTSVPSEGDVHSARDFRVRAVALLVGGDEHLLSDLCAHPTTRRVATNILAGLRMSESRFRRPEFGPYEGMFTSTAAAATLANRYGPSRCWSPSQLEQYAYCPFQFFLASVLRLEVPGEPVLGIDHARRGQMLHWLLSRVHRTLHREFGAQASPALERFAELVEEAIRFLRDETASDALDDALREIDVRKIMFWLERYQQQHAVYDGHWPDWERPPRPAHFEVSFGPPHRDEDSADPDSPPDEADPLSTLEPFLLECDDEVIRFAGRIDRIDLGAYAGQEVFTIVDYKSGKGSPRTTLQAVLDGRSFQLPLYAMAAEQLLQQRGAAPFRAAYWHLAGAGYQEKQAVRFHIAESANLELSAEWSELEATLKPRLLALIRGIRQGEFPMSSADDECTGHCHFSTVCRVNQARSREKIWAPPGAPLP